MRNGSKTVFYIHNEEAFWAEGTECRESISRYTDEWFPIGYKMYPLVWGELHHLENIHNKLQKIILTDEF